MQAVSLDDERPVPATQHAAVLGTDAPPQPPLRPDGVGLAPQASSLLPAGKNVPKQPPSTIKNSTLKPTSGLMCEGKQDQKIRFPNEGDAREGAGTHSHLCPVSMATRFSNNGPATVASGVKSLPST